MSRSSVTIGTPWRTALNPPTTTNSTWASTSRRTISLAKCCILHGLLHDQSPALVLIGSLLRRQRQHQVEQGVIEVSLMPAIITNRRRRTLMLFHGCLLNSPCRACTQGLLMPTFLHY